MEKYNYQSSYSFFIMLIKFKILNHFWKLVKIFVSLKKKMFALKQNVKKLKINHQKNFVVVMGVLVQVWALAEEKSKARLI